MVGKITSFLNIKKKVGEPLTLAFVAKPANVGTQVREREGRHTSGSPGLYIQTAGSESSPMRRQGNLSTTGSSRGLKILENNPFRTASTTVKPTPSSSGNQLFLGPGSHSGF